MTKNIFFVLSLLAVNISCVGQHKWSNQLQVEKTHLFGDEPTSYNFIDIDNVLSNVGIHYQAIYSLNENIKLGMGIGIQQIGTPGYFSSTHIPLEFYGNFLAWKNENQSSLKNFEIIASAGGAFVESLTAIYGFSENVGIGGNFTFNNDLLPNETKIGFRVCFFRDDYIDQLIIGESTNDAILKLFVSIPLNNKSSYPKEIINNYDNTIAALQNKIEALGRTETQLSEEIVDSKIKLEEANNTIDSLLTNYKNPREKSKVFSADSDKDKQDYFLDEADVSYVIVIGSFEDRNMAVQYLERLTLEELATIIFVEDVNTYRVIYKDYPSLQEAILDLEIAKSITPNAWISPYIK
jgi:hypothetical protein